VVQLGRAYYDNSFVILDGPFACIDPLPDTKLHLIYDVTHSVHHSNVGMAAEVPDHLAPLIDRGRVVTPHTHVQRMLATVDRYLHGLEQAQYVGSLFTVRAVLPDVDDTDERLTHITRCSDTVHVLGGKLDASVTAAQRVVELVQS
jgi:hypothetical protein